jgi:hypothetical protein
MSLENQLAELKYDYVRLQGDLEKRESLNLDVFRAMLVKFM